MSRKPYKRQPGESEIRILPDGRLVLVAPDEVLLDVGEAVMPDDPFMQARRKARHHGRTDPDPRS
jgi:hypothetical protein